MVSKMVAVGPFFVYDAPRSYVVKSVGAFVGRRAAFFALHVGGLNLRSDASFVSAMNNADVTYADGMAVVALAKVAGAKKIERAATTDIGLLMLAEISAQLGRAARVAIVGGESGVAARAGLAIAERGDIDVVYTTHGFHRDYSSVLEDLRDAAIDCLVVGMGMPRECFWVQDHWGHLPDAPVITCGGWLGFLAGDELRAPLWMQRAGFEWLYRVTQSPRRLIGRYAGGLVTVGRMIPGQIARRGND